MLTPLERYPIGTVVKLTVPKLLFWSHEIYGVVQGAVSYYVDHYLVIAYHNLKGKKKKLLYQPGFIDALKKEGNATILWTPPYAKRFRTTGEENSLVSFPEGTHICFNKMTGIIVDGFPPIHGDPYGMLVVQPKGAPLSSRCTIGAEQILSYALPTWIAFDFAGFRFLGLNDLLKEVIWEKNTAAT